MTELVRDFQNRALVVIGRVDTLLDAVAPDTMALAQCRWELARILRGYQIHKHRVIFDPIVAAGADRERVALARRMKADCIAMGERFCDHVMRWSGSGIVTAWPDYRTATRALAAALRRHIDCERTGIAALAARAGGVQVPTPARLPPARPHAPLMRY